jgi:hypothetical protein
VVVADVEVLHAVDDCPHHLRVAVAEVVGAAVEMHVDQAPTVHVPEEVALATVDHQVDALVDPELCLARVPVLLRLVQHLGLGFE